MANVGFIGSGPLEITTEQDGAPFVHCADREFGVSGRAELADKNHVQLAIECVGHDTRDRHAATRNAEHNRM